MLKSCYLTFCVYKKAGKKITPLLTGGGQEKDFRSTTENVAGIASMAKALRLVTDKEEFSLPKIAKMKKFIFDELAKYEDISIFSGEGEKLFYLSHIIVIIKTDTYSRLS